MVQRYDVGCLYAGDDEMSEDSAGPWVTYEDYAELEAANAKLRQQLDDTKRELNIK